MARTGDLDERTSRFGGVGGNERLTATTAVVLLVLLAVEGATIPFIGPLLTVHVLVGMVLVPLVLLKVGSTMYRFLRYYTGSRPYVRKGPPRPLLRVIGPMLIVLTVVLLASGIVLTVEHPRHGSPLLLLHKVSFIAWFVVMTVHVLTYVWRVPRLAARDWLVRRSRAGLAGVGTRRLLLVAGVLIGLVLAWVSLPWLTPWHHFLGSRHG